MKNPRLLFLIASLMVLTGCETTTENLRPLPGDDAIAAEDMMDASLTPGVEQLTEPVFTDSPGVPLRFTTGQVWARVFISQGAAPATVQLLATRLSEKTEANGVHRVSYEVKVQLMIDSKTYPLHASATRTSATSGEAAARRAVEAAVVDISKQAKVIEKKVHPDFLPQ